MASTKRKRYAMAALLVFMGLPLYAQAPKPGATPPPAPVGSQPEPTLAFDREVFTYPAEGRRDPFKPLLGGPNSGGPLFNDLALRGIIYSPDPRRSVALVQVGGRRTFRLRRGDVIGNARVVEIQPLRVQFAVENFGTIRTEMLDLRGSTQMESGPIRQIPATGDTTADRARNNPRPNPDSIKQEDRR